MSDGPFLIIKRGLYYRPEASGYTGRKSEAGRYSMSEVAARFPNLESPNPEGMQFVDEDLAPDHSPACPWDVKLVDEAVAKERARCVGIVRNYVGTSRIVADILEDPQS